jgi:hypothetical protein
MTAGAVEVQGTISFILISSHSEDKNGNCREMKVCRQGHVKQVVEQVTEEAHGAAVNEKNWVQIAPSPIGLCFWPGSLFLPIKYA